MTQQEGAAGWEMSARGKGAGRTRRDWENIVSEVALRYGRGRSGLCRTFTGVLRK